MLINLLQLVTLISQKINKDTTRQKKIIKKKN